jgi:hypothetical protein
MANVSELTAGLAARYPELELTEEQVRIALTRMQPGDLDCFFKAIMYLIQTGDFLGAVMQLIQCLFSSGRRTQADIFGCLLNFFMGLLQGRPMNELLVALINCIFGTPPPPPPPPPGDIPPYEGREVNRCG